jgi:hypothetical protein
LFNEVELEGDGMMTENKNIKVFLGIAITCYLLVTTALLHGALCICDSDETISTKIDFYHWNDRIMLAVEDGDTFALVKLLIQGGGCTNKLPLECVSDFCGCTPLMVAARNGNEDIVNLLLNQFNNHKKSSYIHQEDCYGSSAVDHAAARGKINILELFRPYITTEKYIDIYSKARFYLIWAEHEILLRQENNEDDGDDERSDSGT